MPQILTRIARRDGQTMAEYAVILAVITPMVLLALAALSGSIEAMVDSVRAAL